VFESLENVLVVVVVPGCIVCEIVRFEDDELWPSDGGGGGGGRGGDERETELNVLIELKELAGLVA
jgi:hypothetical protein